MNGESDMQDGGIITFGTEAEPAPELCDHCGEDVKGHRRMICTSVKSHTVDADGRAVQARVNTQRWWRFCSEACATEWYATETDEHYLPTGPAPSAAPCEAHPDGKHDFPAMPHEAQRGPTITIKDGQFRIEHADGRIEEGDYVPGMHLGASGASPVCRHCQKDANAVMPKAPHLIDEGEHRDRLLRMVAMHVLPGQAHTLCDHQIFDEAAELNEYWKSPGHPAPLGPRGERLDPSTIPAAPAEDDPTPLDGEEPS